MSVWTKAYQNWIRWKNRPSTESPIDQVALNKISDGLDTVDDRVLSLNSTKADQITLNGLIKNITLNDATGVFTITWYDDSTATIDTLLEKLAVNFDYDDDPTSSHYQSLIIELSDGTVKYADLSSLITEFEFVDTSTIVFETQNDGSIKAVVRAGSINESHLDPNYLAEIQQSVAAAAGSADAASRSASDAAADALMAESHNHGNTGVRADEGTDNAKYYKEQAAYQAGQAAASAANAAAIEDAIDTKISLGTFTIDAYGHLIYSNNSTYNFTVNSAGHLIWSIQGS